MVRIKFDPKKQILEVLDEVCSTNNRWYGIIAFWAL
jgi:hypothetical protein